jgi:hypothetical protein
MNPNFDLTQQRAHEKVMTHFDLPSSPVLVF